MIFKAFNKTVPNCSPLRNKIQSGHDLNVLGNCIKATVIIFFFSQNEKEKEFSNLSTTLIIF